MPTYEYVCTDCRAPLEVVQSIHEPALTECPACEGGRLRKVFGNVGVVVKGSGFYRTDSRSKKSSSIPAKADTKSDSKADATTGSKAPTPAGSSASSSASPASGGSSTSSAAAS